MQLSQTKKKDLKVRTLRSKIYVIRPYKPAKIKWHARRDSNPKPSGP